MLDWIPDTALTVIGAVLLLLGVLLLYPCVHISAEEVLDAAYEDSLKEKAKSYAIAVACIFAIVSLIFLGRTALDEVSAREYNRVVQCIESGYTLYVNGTETELSHITIEDYSRDAITVHDDTKEIHIAANK